MTSLRLLLCSLVYYWRTNLAVLLGVALGTAVIGGALVVGDSVRASLRQMTLDRLGDVDHALVSPHFFREDLAALASGQAAELAPAIVLPASLEYTVPKKKRTAGESGTRRAGQVSLYGVDNRFWALSDRTPESVPEDDGAVVSQTVAAQLGIEAGDEIVLWVEIPTSVPKDTLLGDRNKTTVELPLTISEVLPDESGLARFGLMPSQQLPRNIFVSLPTLQDLLDLDAERDRRTRKITKPARVNALFASQSDGDPANATLEEANAVADSLSERLQAEVTLADIGLRLRTLDEAGYVALESEQMIIENDLATVAQEVLTEQNRIVSPVLVYLANEVHNGSKDIADYEAEEGYSMYSILAGVGLDAAVPFGPFEWVGEQPELPLTAEQVVINDWLAKDLQAAVGDEIEIRYHEVGAHGELPEKSATFTLAGIVKLTGPADDKGLTPVVEGVTDVNSFDEWTPLFEMKNDQITPRDELYWGEVGEEKQYRATPKLFLSLDAAQERFRSRYGEVTSVRFASPADDASELDSLGESFSTAYLDALTPEQMQLFFQPVKASGLQAASGTTDFTGLFFGFSAFLILAAMILIGLLFRLGIERRASSVGLMQAVGLPASDVRWGLLLEGGVMILLGGLLGLALAVGYASLMVYLLTTRWVDAVGTRFLFVSAEPLSLFMGFDIAAVVALIAIWWGMRELKGVTTRELLAGQTEASSTAADDERRRGLLKKIVLGCFGASALIILLALVGLLPNVTLGFGITTTIAAFFLTGMLMLVGSVAALALYLRSGSDATLGTGAGGVLRLGQRNARRHRQRSLLTVSLIASATFVIVAVAAGRKDPSAMAPEKSSGNGGFLLVAESASPILPDMNSAEGRSDLQLQTDVDFTAYSFRVQEGEDASCLNLYQTTRPTILGVPDAFIERGGFAFAGGGDNPWTRLYDEPADGSVPVIGDMNTLLYSLHKGEGETLPIPDADNPEHTLQIVGMLDGSVFQGVLLMSEANFQRLFPDVAGFAYFLFEAENKAADRLTTDLESALGSYGFDAERTVDRIAAFLVVQNTYLQTFQALGGLGLLLGTLGLATVMLRNVLERRSELALLRAIGFRPAGVSALVLAENAFLLLWGLASGTVSALVAMAPHLLTVSADISWSEVGTLLGLVFLLGMASALIAVVQAARTLVLESLRAE